MSHLIDLISIALFANFITHWFTPLHPLRDRIVSKLTDTIVKHNIFWAMNLVLLITCASCISFWGALIYTWNFGEALITSFLAVVIRLIIKLHNNVE
jgi:hypothetical protein